MINLPKMPSFMRSRIQAKATAIFRRPGKLQTLGTSYGGWTIPPSALPPSSICYCVGCGVDVSFDAILAERYLCKVWSYDPTPRAVAHMAELRRRAGNGQPMEIGGDASMHYDVSTDALSRWCFEPVGVWSKNETKRFFAPADAARVSHSILNLQRTDGYFDADCRRVSSLMAANGHDHIDLLKIDIEGAEYEVLNSILEDNIRPKLLCVEFDEGHLPLDDDAHDRISKSLSDIKSMGYWLVHRNYWDFTFIQ